MKEPDANAEERLEKLSKLSQSAITILEKIAAASGEENTDWDEDFE